MCSKTSYWFVNCLWIENKIVLCLCLCYDYFLVERVFENQIKQGGNYNFKGIMMRNTENLAQNNACNFLRNFYW